MTDSIMAIAVAVLVPLCGYLGFQWWQADQRAMRTERERIAFERHCDRLRDALSKYKDKFIAQGFALKYYACAANWQSEAGKHSAAYRDKGSIARKALQGES